MSYRNDTNATYDRTLLSNIPDPTRAEKQEGYNVDLLDDGRDLSAPDGIPSEHHVLAPAEGYSPGAIALARKQGQIENGHEQKLAKTPWYRTRWGITAIVIAIVLVIGAVVGGAVGGTQHHHSKNNTSNSGNQSSLNPSSGGSGNSSSNGSGSEGGNSIVGTTTTPAGITGVPATTSSPAQQSIAGVPIQQTNSSH